MKNELLMQILEPWNFYNLVKVFIFQIMSKNVIVIWAEWKQHSIMNSIITTFWKSFEINNVSKFKLALIIAVSHVVH